MCLNTVISMSSPYVTAKTAVFVYVFIYVQVLTLNVVAIDFRWRKIEFCDFEIITSIIQEITATKHHNIIIPRSVSMRIG